MSEALLSTNAIHRIRVHSWIKIVLRTGAGRPEEDEFVILHRNVGDPLDLHLDEDGSVRVRIPPHDVDVEFPGLFQVNLIESTRDSDVAEGTGSVIVHESHPYVRPRSSSDLGEAGNGAESSARGAKAGLALDDRGEEDPEEEPTDLDLPAGEADIDDDDDHEDEDDELEVRSGASTAAGVTESGPFTWDTPHFRLEHAMTHVFVVPGRIEVRLSRQFFRDAEAVPFRLLEDDEVLVEGETRCLRLRFENLGVDEYQLEVGDTTEGLVSTQRTGYVRFIARGG